MPRGVPAITGKQLIRLLVRDGWVIRRRAKHGLSLSKNIGGINKVTIVPETRASLPDGTLAKILGVKQTSITKKGLAGLIGKYGL